MSYTLQEWSEIASFPICPVQALEEALVDKEINQKDLSKVKGLIENLKKHEEELRELRQEIQRKVRSIEIDLIKQNIEKEK